MMRGARAAATPRSLASPAAVAHRVTAAVTATTAIVAVTVASIAASAPLQAQNGPTPAEARMIEALRAFIPQVLRLNNTPGLNLAIARRGEVIWEAGFGWADLERKVPMTERTVLRSGSMGKTYTATAVMQLVERGVLALDEPVNQYL